MVDAHPQRLIAGQGVIEQAVEAQVVAGLLDRQRLGELAVAGYVGEGIGRDVLRAAVDSQRKGGLVLHQRPADVSEVLLKILGPFPGGERVAGAHRPVAQSDVAVDAKRSYTGLRDDVDEQAAGEVILGSKRVARDVNRFDLRLRRQLGAFEAVDADDGVRTRHVLQLLRHLRRIVRERFDLFPSQRRAEPRARIGGNRLRVAADRDFRFDFLDRQDNHVLVVAAAKTRVMQQP